MQNSCGRGRRGCSVGIDLPNDGILKPFHSGMLQDGYDLQAVLSFPGEDLHRELEEEGSLD